MKIAIVVFKSAQDQPYDTCYEKGCPLASAALRNITMPQITIGVKTLNQFLDIHIELPLVD